MKFDKFHWYTKNMFIVYKILCKVMLLKVEESGNLKIGL